MYTEKIFGFSLLFLMLAPGVAFGQLFDTEWLEQGLLAEFSGDYERALTIWMDARDNLENPDSRIGLEFIRVATEQDMQEYYEKATDMYFWAISSPFTGSNRAAVRQEIERLRPIAGDGIYRQWLGWLEERNDRLASDIRGFWIQMDPTPGSDINERLIEHWQRIAYSRANFAKNSNTVYGTDERANIYIRYGQANHRRSGVLTIDNQNVGRWLARQFDNADVSEEPDENPPIRIQPQRDDDNQSFESLEEYIFQFHEYPEYEIWIYQSLRENDEQPLIFIFGTDVRTGEYHRQKSIDDFIPQRAYLSDQRNQTTRSEFVRQGLTPALALQLLYYEQLININPFFEERLIDIRTSFIDQGPLAYSSLDLALRSQNRELLEMQVAEAPREVSTIGRLLPGIPTEVYQYRLLDEDNNPLIVSFVESRPAGALEKDFEINAEITPGEYATLSEDSLSDYRLNHQLLVYDDEWDEIERFEHEPVLNISGDLAEEIKQSVFISRHEGQNFQSIAARLMNLNPDSESLYPSIFPQQLRGLGTIKNRQPEPLEADAESLELADLILGYQDDVPDDYPFTFRVANDQMIPADQSLVLHFEVYNLRPRAGGITHFELTYRIYPVLDDGTIKTDEEAFYLTINFEQDDTRAIEDLEILTSELSGGLYELQVMVEDQESGQQRNRNIRFEVLN